MIIIFFTLALLYILTSISLEDLNTMLISENKLRFFATIGFIYLIYKCLSNEKIHLIDLIIKNIFTMLIIFIILYLISYISYKVIRIDSLGMGDIKLSSYSSIWLGIEMSFISLFISFMLSSIFSFYGKITNKFKTFQQYPFAPFLSIGIFCSWILDKI